MQQEENKTAMDDIFFADWAKRGPYVAGKIENVYSYLRSNQYRTLSHQIFCTDRLTKLMFLWQVTISARLVYLPSKSYMA